MAASLVLMVVDLGADPEMTIIEPWVERRKRSMEACLVDFEGDCLLLIQRIQQDIEDDHYITKKFCISELNLGEEEYYEWEDIGGSVVFVGSSSNVVVDLSEFSSCRPDSIYFTAINIIVLMIYINNTIGNYYFPEIFLPLQV